LYVDLNPIRAGEVRTPEAASHCSASFRIQARAAQGRKPSGEPAVDSWLAPLSLAAGQLGDVPSQSGRRASDKGLLSMSLEEYLQLFDWCGRQIRGHKQGAIPADLAAIVERLGVTPEELLATVREFPQRFRRLAGTVEQFTKRAAEAGRHWLQGVRCAARVFR
jgi:hypothetical protein